MAIYLIEPKGGFFNGSFSNVKHVKCGVLHGSSLGPLLFSIFTNDLPLALNRACVSMYADAYMVESSAYMETEALINASGMSLVKIEKSRGPRELPCGTPHPMYMFDIREASIKEIL